MRRFNSSLLLKLILAFWVVSILGIVTVAFLAGRVSQLEFSRFVNQSRFQSLVDNLGVYYNNNGNFTNADYLLIDPQTVADLPTKEFLVVDQNGNVLLSKAQRIPPGLPSPEFTRFGFPITSNGRVVAYLIPLRPPRSEGDSPSDILQRINWNLFLGVVFATLLAWLFGWIMARKIVSPLRDLTEATQSIAKGDFEKQVSIKSGDEIGKLADSFNQMIDSLKRSRDLRRQMTADIAHELRNPLSIILGNAEALSEGVLPATPETLDIIYDEAKHLSRLVDDLRTLSLSESGELNLQKGLASPRELVERCAVAFKVRAAEKDISIGVNADQYLPQIDVDIERILQVLANLMDNSVKHTPKGGSISLGATSVEKFVMISVMDTGPGITPEDLPFVFDRFYRGKQSTDRIHDGSGLGLAISRALVELHGGQITVESEPGRFTKFTIQLQAVEA